jgi:hypothetical protein
MQRTDGRGRPAFVCLLSRSAARATGLPAGDGFRPVRGDGGRFHAFFGRTARMIRPGMLQKMTSSTPR